MLKALIVIDNLHTGGVASSLYNYLLYVSKCMKCSLLVFDDNCIDRARIPSNVEILDTPRLLHVLGKV